MLQYDEEGVAVNGLYLSMQIYPNHLFLSGEDIQVNPHEIIGAILDIVSALDRNGFDIRAEDYRRIAVKKLTGREPYSFHSGDEWKEDFKKDEALIVFKRNDGTWANVYYSEHQQVVVMLFGHIGFSDGVHMMPDWVTGGNG